MSEKIYTGQEINEILGFQERSVSKKPLIARCKNAGLIIEALPTKRGCPNQYKIIENNLTLPNEQWIDCYCNNDWEVSSMGRIRLKLNKKLLGSQNSDGYIRVCMIDPITNKTCNKQLNRMVYFSFNTELIPNEKDIAIDHINGIRNDNRLENLRALTRLGNTQARDENQGKIQTLVTELVLKYGYDETYKKIQELL